MAKHIIQKQEFCDKCNHQTKHEEWSEECNSCGIELGKDDYRFHLMYVGRYEEDAPEETDPVFCGMACFTHWIKNGKADEWNTTEHFFSMYLHKKEIDGLKTHLK